MAKEDSRQDLPNWEKRLTKASEAEELTRELEYAERLRERAVAIRQLYEREVKKSKVPRLPTPKQIAVWFWSAEVGLNQKAIALIEGIDQSSVSKRLKRLYENYPELMPKESLRQKAFALRMKRWDGKSTGKFRLRNPMKPGTGKVQYNYRKCPAERKVNPNGSYESKSKWLRRLKREKY